MITNDKSIVELKHFILREVCRLAWANELTADRTEEIVYRVSPGPKPQYRCCVYKEREIVRGRVRLAMGQSPDVTNPMRCGHLCNAQRRFLWNVSIWKKYKGLWLYIGLTYFFALSGDGKKSA